MKEIKKTKNLELVIDEVKSLLIKDKKIIGVTTSKHHDILAKKVIITAGTYMNAITHIGDEIKQEGPQGLERSFGMSDQLRKLGFEMLRLKTGTPPRVLSNSINYAHLSKEPGMDKKLSFSFYRPHFLPFDKQVLCYLTYTNEKTHQIINKNKNLSAMFSGSIKGVGPRYCPSIEDKVTRFADKPRHQIFIEPESLKLNTMYLQGLSTSLPRQVQEEFVHSIKGLEKAVFAKYAYAIEYDAINPIQLWPSLESKRLHNLYFAGQVNGTSGYEEAACQGLMAGINAGLAIHHKKPLILQRDEAYIGVLIDDLVTKGVTDPYRLLTSRAEYRLLLRNDNADDRLIKYGKSVGLIKATVYKTYLKNDLLMKRTIKYLKSSTLKNLPKQFKRFANSTHSLYDFLKRPEIKLRQILPKSLLIKLTDQLIDKIEIAVKFEGYIKNQTKHIERINKYDSLPLTKIKDYKLIKNLSLEAIDKLNKIKPLTLGQAKRINGINMTDLVIIKYYLDKQ
ncbi:tRNA uridine 5-carboxymethylaminomethyl modification enzyme MnmG [Bacilli bacterium]|nr:tRNA uridine 5-carboxymethylaminomethyl modification enzyme MnmG [Bacilli bacterium]